MNRDVRNSYCNMRNILLFLLHYFISLIVLHRGSMRKLKMMKSRCIPLAIMIGMIIFLARMGFCPPAAGMSEWMEKTGQGSINWSSGYIEAIGIGAMPDKSLGKINARPVALRDATIAAQRNLLEIAKGVQVDARTTVRDFTMASDVISTQVEGLIKAAQVVDQQYVSDGTVEVKLRMPLYGNLSQIMMPLYFEKQKSVMPPVPVVAASAPPAQPAPSVPAVAVTPPSAPVVPTGLVVDARGLGAQAAIWPRIYDEDGRELYDSAGLELECIVSQGVSGYARDPASAQSNPRVTPNPLTVKALKISSTGKCDLHISNADAKQIRMFSEQTPFIKKCRIMIISD